ncbi:MAG: serine/threonine-protein kinase [Cyanobacteriota bacterium]|nr:serine/threonine-protein kinase [Cyanobacteriota bacterium]
MVWTAGTSLYGDRYRIQYELGRGRFGTTYLASDRNSQPVVIKTLSDRAHPDRDRLQQLFVQGAFKLAKCQHPHIVKAWEPFQEGGIWCIPMEYIDGFSLARRARAILPEEKALQYIRQIGEALIEVHRNGLLHRDIRPGNILLRGGEADAVLIDFDLAMDFDHELTVTRTAELMKGFAALELYSRSAQRGPFTDIYSLGATLYALLTGETPVSADERKISGTPLVPPQEYNSNISDRVNRAILWAMKLEAEDRPQSVEEWLSELGLREEVPSTPVNFTQPRRFNWSLFWTAVGAIGTLLAGLAVIPPLIEMWRNDSTPTPVIS